MAKSSISEETKAGWAEIAQRITQAATSGGPVVGLISPVSLSCLHPDGAYKNVAMTGSEEFVLKGMRPGQRWLILELTPMEVSAYTQAEVDVRKGASLFPTLLEWLAGALGAEEHLAAAAQLESGSERWASLEADYLADAAARAARVSRMASDKLAANPRYGRFG